MKEKEKQASHGKRSWYTYLFNLGKWKLKFLFLHLVFLFSPPSVSAFVCVHACARMCARTRAHTHPFSILPLRFNLTITFAIGVLRISRALRLKLHTLCTIYHGLTCVMFQAAAPRGYSSRLLLCWSAAEKTEAPSFSSPFIPPLLVIKAASSPFWRPSFTPSLKKKHKRICIVWMLHFLKFLVGATQCLIRLECSSNQL